jgi:alpha-tubulin suppressor-like RCC1 family protein
MKSETLWGQIFLITAAIALPSVAGEVSGTVVGWGQNMSGAATGVPWLGWASPGTSTNSPFATGAVMVAGQILSNAIAISAGDGHGLALKNDGTVSAWGWNIAGQATGTPTPGSTNGVVTISGQVLSNVTAISAAHRSSLALKNDGTVVAWGNEPDAGSAHVPAGLSNVVAISAGRQHYLALRRDGAVLSWGTANEPSGLSNIVAIVADRGIGANALALRSDGTVAEWSTRGIYNVATVPAGLSNVVAIAGGWGHCLALRSDGTVFGWGANGGGQATGVPTVSDRYTSSGLVVLGGQTLTNVMAIAAGHWHSLALRRDGTVVAWGRMNNGLQPATVPGGLSNVIAIAAGDDLRLAITTNWNIGVLRKR